ncbi:ferritin-like domain-containing protein [Actinomycetospora soli]|uniref:ferritin-like domain-containing protein n=1 Tax=Actinomycetospora soli TaxID=2893887 RepID=UPI001E557191|nr:ferritin-like domain-containing protein [Actinomycetospora soli]MCD2189650.1 ferritin-like domain-containing protein [Actinomycetospora soli]
MSAPVPDSDGAPAAAQAALGAEHAAVWCCGLATAFLPASAAQPLADAALAHRQRRDALVARLEASGEQPVPAAAAYATPRPVTDAASAAALLVTAEDDVAGAWRALLERTDDRDLRTTGVEAMTAATTVGRRWRILAGVTPTVPSLPGSAPA